MKKKTDDDNITSFNDESTLLTTAAVHTLQE